MRALFGAFLQGVELLSFAQAVERLDPSKSPGWYWRRTHGSTKSAVLQKLAGPAPETEPALDSWRTRVGQILYDFAMENTPVYSATLKDELRPTNKGPRLFVTGPLEHTFLGNYLFGAQNDALMEHIFEHPIVMGIDMPGPGQTKVFSDLQVFASGRVGAFDASKWDASVPLWAFTAVRDLRKHYLPVSAHAATDRYYDGVYNGWVEVLGYMVRVPGQKSGQSLTASDNSLAMTAIMCLHAIRSGLSFAEFRRQVLFFTMGDDLVYASRTDKFQVVPVADTFRDCGVYMENDQPGNVLGDILTASFLGCTPVWRRYMGESFLLPRFRVARLINSALWWRDKTDVAMHWGKLVALTVLIFADQQAFETMRVEVLEWFDSHREELMLPSTSAGVTSLYGLLVNDPAIFALFTGVESGKSSSSGGVVPLELVDF